MNSQEFVDILNEVVVVSSIKSMEETLKKPSGGRPLQI